MVLSWNSEYRAELSKSTEKGRGGDRLNLALQYPNPVAYLAQFRMKIALTSIFSKVKIHRPTSIAILCLKLNSREEWEDKEKVIRYEVDSSVSLLRTTLQNEGIRVVTLSVDQLEGAEFEVISCDLCIIAGDPYYQLFRWGRTLIDKGFTGPLYLQIFKEDASKPSAARMAVTQASNYNVLRLLSSLVYLTRLRPEPKELEFDLPSDSTALIVPPVTAPATFTEGKVRVAISNVYERNPAARSACIEIHGLKCVACGFDFECTYGSAAKGLIHVHHLNQIAGTQSIRNVNPREDLRPVCPNCHLFIHSRSPMYSILEVQKALSKRVKTKDS